MRSALIVQHACQLHARHSRHLVACRSRHAGLRGDEPQLLLGSWLVRKGKCLAPAEVRELLKRGLCCSAVRAHFFELQCEVAARHAGRFDAELCCAAAVQLHGDAIPQLLARIPPEEQIARNPAHFR